MVGAKRDSSGLRHLGRGLDVDPDQRGWLRGACSGPVEPTLPWKRWRKRAFPSNMGRRASPGASIAPIGDPFGQPVKVLANPEEAQ